MPRFVPPPDSLMKGLESTTSSSILHGFNMILIMLSSLGAFICSLVQDACDESFAAIRCSVLVAAAFPLVNVCSCITFFVMYFLHLVGQCDYLSWSARRKVSMELMGTLCVLLSVVTVTILVYLTTLAWNQETTRYGIVFAVVSVLCILVRILLLAREIPMLLSKPQADARSAVHQQVSLTTRSPSPHSPPTPPSPQSPPLEFVIQNQPQLPQRRRSVRRKKRTLAAMRSFSLKRTSVADTIDLESGIASMPVSSSVTFTRMAMLQSDDFLPRGSGSGRGEGQSNSQACVTTDSARSSMTTFVHDHVFRSSSEVEDERTLLSAYPKVTHI